MFKRSKSSQLDVAPDFELIDTEGRSFRLYDQLADGHVVLVFNRGFR